MEKVSDPSLPSYFHQKIHNKKCPKAMDWLRPIPPPLTPTKKFHRKSTFGNSKSSLRLDGEVS